MDLHWAWFSTVTLLGCYVFIYQIVRRLNGWYYDLKLRNKEYPLPPGDMGWPLIGNLLVFIKHFSSDHPNSLITNLVLKYGPSGIYKTHMFGNPSIIICEAEMSKKVLLDDVNFKLGYPKTVKELAKCRPMTDISTAKRRHFRRLITAPIVGHKALAMYLERIEDIVVNSLEELSSMKHPVEILKEMKKVSFKAIIHIFMGSSNKLIIDKIGSSFTHLSNGMFCIPLNIPGFTFHKAHKARKKLAKIVQSVVDERRMMIKNGEQVGDKKDLMDILLEIEDENGEKLEDEDIIDLLIGLLFAGHESTATCLMWSISYLTQNPHMLKKAKEEQEEIMRTRDPSQKQLSLNEIKQMVYLSQVINELLRCVNIAFSLFREATTDVNINGMNLYSMPRCTRPPLWNDVSGPNFESDTSSFADQFLVIFGYLIPKGWRVLVWARGVHMNSEYYPNPEEFNPSRWEDHIAKPGTFLPFGAGSRLCPGADLAKLEISVFLHYFLLSYKLEQVNPKCPITNLPVCKPTDNCLAKVTRISCD